MVETMIRLKPVADKTPVTAHFLRGGQSLGFSLSTGAVNVTREALPGAGVATVFSPFSVSTASFIFSIKEY
jgi:hypothetical protein